MSQTHHVPPVVTEDADEAAEAIRSRGMRLTAARRELLAALFSAEAPVSAEELADGLEGRFATFDTASVYRNLEAFEAIGLVRHVHLGHGPGLYTLSGEIADAYLVCESCGSRRALSHEQLEPVREAVAALDFEASFSHFPILGLCRKCARARDADQRKRRGGGTAGKDQS